MTRKLIVAAMIVVMHGIAFAAEAPATQADAVDLSTPRAAVISYFQAMRRLDETAAKQAAVRNPKIDELITAAIAEGKAQRRYMDAARKKFGADHVRVPDVTSILIEQVKKGEVIERDDEADIGSHGDYPCRKVDGKWRFDLVRQNAGAEQLEAAIKYLVDSTAAYNEFTPKVDGGEWKSFEEMDQARPTPMPPPPPAPKKTSN